MTTTENSRLRHRLERWNAPSLTNWQDPSKAIPEQRPSERNVIVDCGWGRLLFAHTFDDLHDLAETLRQEQPGRRDIAFYLWDPHVVLSMAPQELFLDPSHTYRLWLSTYRPASERPKGFTVRRMRVPDDIEAVNRIYAARRMVPVDPCFFQTNVPGSRVLSYLVAADAQDDSVLGVVTGVDHVRAFEDPEKGSSLWALAVDPQATYPGIGQSLVRTLVERFVARGREFMDLSVMHDNRNAIALYDKLGFQRVPVFALKNKNSINEKLFIGPPIEEHLNPYAMIIINEARRRGIAVNVIDAEGGFFELSFGGRSIQCRESLSELTSAVSMSLCDDKSVTRRLLAKAELAVPEQQEADTPENNAIFLKRHGRLVVKPARGEQGRGITVDVRTTEELETAIERARDHCEVILLEQFVTGHDLRIIVIDYKVVAAAIRKPAEIVGNGRHTVDQLIQAQSRRRAAATGGESTIPMDNETERCVRANGYEMDSVLPEGEKLAVRKTANLHTGGTIHDCTDRLHRVIVNAAIKAARTLRIPVVGFDFMVPRIDEPNYVIIEANERPGLANHEPQPTAERFIDMLFPQSTGVFVRLAE